MNVFARLYEIVICKSRFTVAAEYNLAVVAGEIVFVNSFFNFIKRGVVTREPKRVRVAYRIRIIADAEFAFARTGICDVKVYAALKGVNYVSH